MDLFTDNECLDKGTRDRFQQREWEHPTCSSSSSTVPLGSNISRKGNKIGMGNLYLFCCDILVMPSMLLHGCLSTTFIFDLVWPINVSIALSPSLHLWLYIKQNTKVWHISTISIIYRYVSIHPIHIRPYNVLYSIYLNALYVFFDETYKLKLIIFLHLVFEMAWHSTAEAPLYVPYNGLHTSSNGKKELLHAELSKNSYAAREVSG